MKPFFYIQIIPILVFSAQLSLAQVNDLEAILSDEMGESTDYTFGTFLSTFVLTNHSVELLSKNGLNFRFSHKFGYLNSGKKGAYGFDNSSVYMGLEYAPTDWINIGLGRASMQESVNGHLKLRLLRQTSGARNIPLSLVLFSEADYLTGELATQELTDDFAGRLEYTSQLLIARKFKESFSLQIMPSLVHRNLVETKEDLNNVGAIGFGATYKIMRLFRINAEYFLVQDHDTEAAKYYDPVSFGICYQTSRHTFELFASNTQGITGNYNIARTTGNFWQGDIAIGFNVSIIFTAKR